MRELSKSIVRRMSDHRFPTRFFKGKGVDIGGLPDPLTLYQHLFPLIESTKIWDLEDGDAQFMDGVPDESFDFVHSSHCLEHLISPLDGIKNWLRILKNDGHLIVTVPDEDLYEQGVFPSTFNRDHKWTFTIFKKKSWSEKSINILSIAEEVADHAELLSAQKLDSTYNYSLPRFDQTLTPIAESGIEFIFQKKKNRLVQREGKQPDAQLRRYYNQYLDDWKAAKEAAKGAPFKREDPL